MDIWATTKKGLVDAIRELDILAETRTSPQGHTKARNNRLRDVDRYPHVHVISAKDKAKMTRALEELAKLDFYRQEPETANHYTSTVSLPILVCLFVGMLTDAGYVSMAC